MSNNGIEKTWVKVLTSFSYRNILYKKNEFYFIENDKVENLLALGLIAPCIPSAISSDKERTKFFNKMLKVNYEVI